MGYKFHYKQTVSDGQSTPVSQDYALDTFESVWDISPLNSPWANSGCYAGAIPANDSDIGTYSVASWIKWNKDSVYSDMRDMTIRPVKGSSQQNLRFMAKYNNSSFTVDRQYYNWTNLREATVTAVKDAMNSLTQYTTYDPYKRQDKNEITNGTSNSPLNIAPLEHLQINNLIFVPRFVIKEIEYYKFDDISGGYQNSENTSVSTMYSWADIKPEDKTPAGENYDADLFEKGWKEINPVNEDGRRFRYCCGVILIPYYGNSSYSYNTTTDTYTAGTNPDDGRVYGDRQVFGSVPSQTDEYPVIGSTSALNRPCLMVLTESYNTVTGGLTYSTPTGIMFANYVASGNVSGNTLALQPSWSLMSNFQTFSATSHWTTQFFTANNGYCNMYADLDPATSNTAPDLSIPTKIDFDIDISLLYEITNLPTAVRLYIPNDNPIAFSFSKNNRNITATNCAFFSINALWHTIASLGCYVADDFTAAQKAPTGYYTGNNNHLYLGHMDSNGITDGIMLQGDDIPTAVQSTIDDIIQNTPYTPVIPGPGGGDPSEEGPDKIGQGPGWKGDDTGPRTGYSDLLGFPANMMSLYAMDIGLANSFGSSLWASMGSEQFMDNMWTALFNSATLDFAECLKYFPVCRMYPINFSSSLYTATGAASLWTPAIYFGRAVSPINLSGSPYRMGSPIIYGGTCSIDVPDAEDWQDLEPYTSAQIYIPYCGQYSVPVADIVGANINTETYIDILTGEMLVYVVRSKGGLSNTLFTCTGRIGYDVPLTTDSAALKIGALAASVGVPALVAGTLGAATIAAGTGAKVGTAIATKGAAAEEISAISERQNSIVGDITRGASGASSGISGALNALGANMTGGVTSITSPSMGGMMGINGCPNMVITIKKTRVVTSGLHGSTAAYPLHHSRTLGEMSGLVKCVNPNVSGITATATELSQIANYLESGVIV